MNVPLPVEILIRPAISDQEADMVRDFYAANPHANVKERDFAALSRAVMDGLVMLAVEPGADPSHDIWRGVCVAFYKPNDYYAEVGGSQCLLNGFGLQKLLIAACTLTSYELRPPSRDIFAITGVSNLVTQRNLISCGLDPSAMDTSLQTDAGVVGFNPQDKVLHRFKTPPPHLCRAVLKHAENTGQLMRGADTIRLRIELPVIDCLKQSGLW